MFDLKRMERLKAIMDRHSSIKNSNTVDIRPASGMVGQKCEGYISDAETGRLIRIVEDVDTDTAIGPGSYDPMMPTAVRSVRISRNGRNTDLANYNVKPGPCDHCREPKETRMLHSLVHAREPPVQDPPMGYSLDHKSWLPEPITRLPKSAHPETQFRTELSTSQFASQTNREIFPQSLRYTSPGPAVHTKQREPVEFGENEGSSVFKDATDRFAIPGPFPPPSTAYTIPDQFGTSPGKRIVKPADIRHAPPLITPDGAQYAPEVVQKPAKLNVPSPVFRYEKDRFLDDSFKTPAPGEYDIHRDITAGTKKQSIRARMSKTGDEWDDIPQRYTPGVGQYEQDVTKPKAKSGYISTIGHCPYETKEDRPLAFRTQHSSMIKKSFNAHYFNSIKGSK